MFKCFPIKKPDASRDIPPLFAVESRLKLKDNKSVEKAAKLIVGAKNPMIFTGAGMSRDSGIQTFRDADGLWKNIDINKMATLEGFLSDPEKVWLWYLGRIEKIKAASPNEGHRFVAFLDTIFEGLSVVTQNIDGLHQKAGSKNVTELHGTVHGIKCISCNNKMATDEADYTVLPPGCYCGGILRPDVVWFGEALPADAVYGAFTRAEKTDLVIVIGTSCVVYPAAEIPFIVKRRGGRIIEINPDETPLTPYADVKISNPSDGFYKELTSLVREKVLQQPVK